MYALFYSLKYAKLIFLALRILSEDYHYIITFETMLNLAFPYMQNPDGNLLISSLHYIPFNPAYGVDNTCLCVCDVLHCYCFFQVVELHVDV